MYLIVPNFLSLLQPSAHRFRYSLVRGVCPADDYPFVGAVSGSNNSLST